MKSPLWAISDNFFTFIIFNISSHFCLFISFISDKALMGQKWDNNGTIVGQ